MIDTLTYTGTLTVLDCGLCGITFAMPGNLYREANRDHNIWFWCPLGHRLHYPGQTEEQKLRECLKAERESNARSIERAQGAIRSRNAMKGQVTKIKNRVARGVCPCCNRSFPQLAEHMSSEHPDFIEPV